MKDLAHSGFASIPTEPEDEVSSRPVRFRTRIKGEGWGAWRKPGCDDWRVTAAEREFIKPRSTLDGLCIEYENGQRVTHFLCSDGWRVDPEVTPVSMGMSAANEQKTNPEHKEAGEDE